MPLVTTKKCSKAMKAAVDRRFQCQYMRLFRRFRSGNE